MKHNNDTTGYVDLHRAVARHKRGSPMWVELTTEIAYRQRDMQWEAARKIAHQAWLKRIGRAHAA